MHQSSILRQMRTVAGIAAAALALGATAADAQAVTKCRQAIVKNAAKYASSITKALQKCEEGRLKGKITTTCAVDPKTVAALGKSATKLGDGITKACTGVSLADMGFAGKVNRCAGGNGNGNRCVDDGDCRFPPASTGPEDGVCTAVNECPTFLNGRLPGDDSCEIALSTPATVASCIECAASVKIDAVINAFYTTLNAFSSDKAVQKCQVDIGKRTAKFFDAVEKALAKCEDAVLKTGMGTCPDVTATSKINGALTKLQAALSKSCGTGATISKAAAAGKIFGAASIFGSCGVAGAQTSAGLAANLSCLAENAAGCDVALSLGSNACSIGDCGNGQIEATESCDDGNTARDSGVGPLDICPSDCTIAACSVSGTQNATISIQTPVELLGATLLLSYDDAKVSVPGVLSDPPVQERVSSLVFATTPRDSDTSLRLNLEDPTVTGVPAGVAATITFDKCGAAIVTPDDFGCTVVDATNEAFENITGVTCTVSVP